MNTLNKLLQFHGDSMKTELLRQDAQHCIEDHKLKMKSHVKVLYGIKTTTQYNIIGINMGYSLKLLLSQLPEVHHIVFKIFKPVVPN